MALYFESRLKLPADTSGPSGKRVFLDVTWHKTFPLLAIAHCDERNGGIVSIYNHAVEETTNVEPSVQQGSQVVNIRWHPHSKILAMGYQSGEVVVWNHEEGECFEGPKGHSSAIMLMEWSSDGSVLVSSDSLGFLVIWHSDSQGHLQTQAVHDFKDPVCQIVFRGTNFQPVIPEDDNERALGMMTSWRPKTGVKRRTGRTITRQSNRDEGHTLERCFFAGVLSGTIFYLKENGSSEDVLSSGSAVRSLLYHGQKDILIVMTEAFIMGQFSVDENGDLREISKMKLSGEGDVRLHWIGVNTLAVLCNEPYIRLWDVETSENIVIEPKDKDVGEDEVFLSIDYNSKNSILCCCTSKGRVVMWKETDTGSSSSKTSEDHWEWYNSTSVPNSSKLALWCPSETGLLAVNAIQEVLILKEQELCYTFAHGVSCVQTSPTTLSILMFKQKLNFDIRVDMQLSGITTSGEHVVVWNGSKVVIYEIGPLVTSHYRNCGGFSSKSDIIKIHEQNLYTLEQNQVQVRTFQGTVKQTLPFSAQEGPPITMEVGGDFIVCASENGFLKVWHVGRREAKLHTQPKDLTKLIDNFGEVIQAVTNPTGDKVALYVAQVNLIPDSRLFILDLSEGGVTQITIQDRFITKLFWERVNPGYLGIETKLVPVEFRAEEEDEESIPFAEDAEEDSGRGSAGKEGKKMRKFGMTLDVPCDVVVVTFFLDGEKGFLIHELRGLEGASGGREGKAGDEHLAGLEIPHLYFTRNCSVSRMGKNPSIARIKEMELIGKEGKALKDSSRVMIDRDPILDFDGIEDEEREGREALIKYVYSTLVDDIDGALNATRLIKNQKVYNNMLRNCLKTRRLDVAFICLSKLKNVRVCQILRETVEEEPEEEAHVAMLAIQLGLLSEAEALYKSCNRYDLLLDLYILSERWEDAVAVCENHRRIQLKSTYHAWAKCLEKEKKVKEAIKMYEKAETHKYEVPRMLSDEPQQLENYVLIKKDKELYQWWAQYLESSGDTESALQYYELAQDWLSLVRLLCFCGDHDKAVIVSEKVNDRAAAYHLARTLEDRGDIGKAIGFYSRAGAFGHAIRICKDNGLIDELWRMALKAEPSDQAEAGKYFETMEPPNYSRAIQLYHRAGYGSKALDLAFATGEFETLQMVVRDIISKPSHNTDPLLLQRCAEFFVENNEVDKAIDMLVAAQKYPEAMDLCVKKKFTITEEIAERLTAPKGAAGIDEGTRKMLLEKMGECLTFQGSYQLAAKKYTQAGNKIQAMKSLLKSGDTKKIKYYADICRHREIYVLAANYMQTTDLSRDPSIIQTIEHYYNKAQAYDSLAAFYETLAQAEIEDNRDYKNALYEYRKVEGALKLLIDTGAQYEDKLRAIQTRIFNIHKFISIKDNFPANPEISMQELKKMKDDGKLDGIRLGDMYAVIIEYLMEQGQGRQAAAILDEMKVYVPNSNYSRYLNPDTLKKIEKLGDFRSNKTVASQDFNGVSAKLPENGVNPVSGNPGDDILQLLKYKDNQDPSGEDGEDSGEEDDEEEELEEEEEIEDEEDEDAEEEEEEDEEETPKYKSSQQYQYQQQQMYQQQGSFNMMTMRGSSSDMGGGGGDVRYNGRSSGGNYQ